MIWRLIYSLGYSAAVHLRRTPLSVQLSQSTGKKTASAFASRIQAHYIYILEQTMKTNEVMKTT